MTAPEKTAGRATAVAARVLACGVALSFAFSACGGGSKGDSLRTATLAEGCLINTDCESPLVCAFRRCHNQCETSRDCPNEERCVASDRPFRVCQLEDERDCLRNSDCPPAMVCGVDGECRDQCVTERDCIPGQLCVTGTCADPEELEGGELPVDPGTIVDAGGAPCVRNSDCSAPLVCLFGFCREECVEDRDCATDERCAAARCMPSGVVPDGGSACVYNSDCTAPQLCIGGACRCECVEDRDCAGSLRCDGCACVADVPDGAPPEFGQPCGLPSDCPAGLVCLGGRCIFECQNDIDCGGPGLCCRSNRCATGVACAPDGGTDAAPLPDGGCGACVSNFECDDGLWCNGFERCFAGCCVPAAETPCDSHSACIQDSCDEATQTCSSITLAPEDADGDGHLDFGCGGDDCDDDDDTVFTGAPELCNAKDDNCNGIADDFARVPFGTQFFGNVNNITRQASAVPTSDGGYLAFMHGASDTVVARKFDAAGGPQGVVSSLNPFLILDSASGNDTALVVLLGGNTSGSLTADVALYSTTTPSLVTSVRLVGATNTAATPRNMMDVVWTGTEYLVGYVDYSATPTVGKVVLVDTTGGLSGGQDVATVDGSGELAESIVVVANSGATTAALYRPLGADPTVSIYGTGGGFIAGPVELTNATGHSAIAIAGTQGGFVAITSDGTFTTTAHFISTTGTLGATAPVPGAGFASHGDGATDGDAAMFVMDYAGTPRYAVAHGNLTRPIEAGTVFNGASNATGVSLSGSPTDGFVASAMRANNTPVVFTRFGCR